MATHSHSIPEDLKKELHLLCTPGENEIDRFGVADSWLGDVLGEAALSILSKASLNNSDIIAIGCHG